MVSNFLRCQMYWFKRIQKETTWGMPQYILAHLGFDGWIMFYLDLTTFKRDFLSSHILLKYLSAEGGEGERHQLPGLHPRPSGGGTTGFRNRSTNCDAINLFVWEVLVGLNLKCLKSPWCQNTFAQPSFCAKPLSWAF